MPRAKSRRRKGRPRKKGDAARSHADRLRKVLFEAQGVGLELPQLIRACELTRSQVRSGLAMLRDQCAEKGWPPIVWLLDGGYRFSGDPDLLRTYEIGEIHEHLVEIRRLMTGTVAPHATLHPADKWVAYLVTQLAAVESTLDLLVSSKTS
ncbi:RacP protein [Streptomyces sp. Ag109_G2-15]|uniref:RacP protein n=1 Tax=Streptomyces sp. Ag109_G2-15 TaxID=1938850 RepID=UPI000BD4A74E|nr:RacP protein [Streptomyces sp. Ag109_G2-15]SOE06480.1 hypothetical protein SAMN06272765_7296 [Streptomyces sp. Ag109_G2-15]